MQKKLSLRQKIKYYLIAGVLTMVVFTIVLILGGKRSRPEYDSKRFRKVIKKGLLWDDIEYHER